MNVGDSHPSTSTSTSNSTGQRRPRPNSYTPQACERCRTRKQRCITDGEEACKSCVDSGSPCVYAPKSDTSKRTRRESSQPVRSDEDGDSSPPIAAPISIPIPQQPTVQSSSNPSFSFNPPLRNFAMSAPANPRPSLSNVDVSFGRGAGSTGGSTPGVGSSGGASTWQTLAGQHGPMIQPPPAEIDWRAWMTQMSPSVDNGGPTIPLTTSPINVQHQHFMLPPELPPPPPQVQSDSIHQRQHSPAQESDDGPVFETAKGLAMISLEAAAEPHYVGESSGSLWTTLVARGLHTRQPTLTTRAPQARPSRSPSPARRAALRQSLAHPLPKDTAAYVLETVYCHLHPRYPFMDWTAFERYWHLRDDIFLSIAQGRQLDKNTAVAAFFVLMILAIGSQYCKSQSLSDLLRPQDYYVLAMPYLNYIVQLHNLANLQGLLLLAVYSLRDSKGPSVWHLSGMNVRLCITLGLHRNPAGRTARALSKYAVEMRKRVFWTCYMMDRMMCMLLGRPPCISDDDIDVDLPDTNTPTSELSLPVMRNGSMVSAVHHIKLRRIESQIQRSVYAIGNRKPNRPPSDFWPLLNTIDQWEAEIPAEASSEEYKTVPSCSKEWFQLKGVEARLNLLRPLCMDNQESTSVFLIQLAQNAARGCELQKRAHQLGTPNSGISVHSTFICGLALLYSVFLRPTILPLREVFSAIKAASNTLFAYSQQEPHTASLYDYFEALSSVCIDRISQQSNSSPPTLAVNAGEWQKVSTEATSNIDSSTAGEYVDLLRTLGIDIDNSAFSAPLPDTSWDFAGFSSGNLLYDNGQPFL